MKNENKHSEMIDIMHTLHQYVPIISEESEGAPSGLLCTRCCLGETS